MSFEGQWNVGDKVTEKHLGGQSRRLANNHFSGGIVTRTGVLLIQVSQYISLIAGFEQRSVGAWAPPTLSDTTTYWIYLTYNEVVTLVTGASPATPGGYADDEVLLIAKVVTSGGDVTQIINFDNHGSVDNDSLKYSAVGQSNLQKGSPHVEYHENTLSGTADDYPLFTVAPNAKGRFKGIRLVYDGEAIDRKAERLKFFFDGSTDADIDLSFEELSDVGDLNGISAVVATASPYVHTMEIISEGDFATDFVVKIELEATSTAATRVAKSITNWERFVL